MEREKEIEEMKEWTSLSCIEITKKGCNGRSCADCIATTILNAGYLKLHAGTMMINKAELETLRNDLINAECNLNHITLQLEEESQRIASEIIDEITEVLKDFIFDCDDGATICEKSKIVWRFDKLKTKLKEKYIK